MTVKACKYQEESFWWKGAVLMDQVTSIVSRDKSKLM